MKANLKHSNGIVKSVKVGYSWTTLFFNFLVPMVRAQWSDFAILIFSCGPTLGILPLIWTFKINKRYCQSLLLQGYKPATPEDVIKLKQKGYYIETV